MNRFGAWLGSFIQQRNDGADSLPRDSRDAGQKCLPELKPERHGAYPSVPYDGTDCGNDQSETTVSFVCPDRLR